MEKLVLLDYQYNLLGKAVPTEIGWFPDDNS